MLERLVTEEVVKKRMIWQRTEKRWVEQKRRRSMPAQVQQKREEVYAASQYAAGFHCLVEEWHECEKKKVKLRDIAVCGHEQIPLNEMRKEQQQDEDAREV